eukprot:155424-Rhodomonas_salina.1
MLLPGRARYASSSSELPPLPVRCCAVLTLLRAGAAHSWTYLVRSAGLSSASSRLQTNQTPNWVSLPRPCLYLPSYMGRKAREWAGTERRVCDGLRKGEGARRSRQ